MGDEQYIAAHAAVFPGDTGRVLVSNRSTGNADVLPQQLFAILRQADRFDTIAGHTKRLLTAGWEDDGSGFVESAFTELIARGLMVSKSTFLEGLLEKGGGRAAPPPVTSLVVTTQNRNAQLQRCLGGFIENTEKYGRIVDYLVIDDSRDKDQGARAKSTFSSFTSKGTRISYAGLEEKKSFMHELVGAASAEGLPEDVVAFCLFGEEGYARTYGVNRNGLLLATTGELIVSTDDDTVYQPVVPAKYEKQLELTSRNDPTVLRYYADRKELLAAHHGTSVDIISCHERLLGRSIAGCTESLGPDCALEVSRIGPESVHKLRQTSSIVTATMSGYWGDCGMGSPNAALELQGESRDFVMRSKTDYIRATESREVFRSVSGYTISDGSLFMTTNAGLDNRLLIPPFLPVGRNEDGIFAITLHICAQDALIGHLPLAVYHAPDEVRGWPEGAFLDPAPRFADIVAAIMASFAPSPGRRNVRERLSSLGKLFVDLGTLETDEFEEQIKTIWMAAMSRYIGFLQNLLDTYHGQPDYWAKDVLSFMGNFKDFVVHRSPAVTRESFGRLPPDQAKESCRRLVRKFGELLQWWPVIYDTARHLREAGVRLVRPI